MFIFKKMSLRYPSLNSHCSLFGSHSFKWKWRSGERGLVPLTVQTISWVLFLKTNDCTSECNRRGFVLLCILSHTILKDRQVPGNRDSMKPVTFAASSRVRLRGWLFLPFNGVCVCVCVLWGKTVSTVTVTTATTALICTQIPLHHPCKYQHSERWQEHF